MRRKTLFLALLSLLAFGACDDGESEQTAETPQSEEPEAPAAPAPLREVAGEHFEALPSDLGVDEAKALLGRALFHDNRLSGDETVSCSTCHSMEHGGAEPRATSTGIRGQVGPINSPTVLNARFNFRQFWDGREADLLGQAAGPVGNPIEMDGNWETIVERLSGDEEFSAQMQAAYGENAVTQANILDAIVQYEDSLVTPSPFDAWLGGDDDALNEEQQRGLRSFVETGCTTCHRGVNLGGDSYQRMGLVHNYFEERGGDITEADRGRFNATEDEADMHKFKVPTLRNIANTAPYFHDGSQQELAAAVRIMAHVQLGRELEDAQINDIVAFLNALTGELPANARIPSADAGEAEGGEAAEGEAAPTTENAAEGVTAAEE